MNIQHKRMLFRVADVLITLMAIFLLLDALLGFTRHPGGSSAQSRPVSQNGRYTNLSTSCVGGFSNRRTVGGVTQIASHGTPFNAYQLTLTNTGNTVLTIYSVTVDLTDSQGHIFGRQHDTNLANGTGITLNLGQSRQLVETAGVNHPVASCDLISWQS